MALRLTDSDYQYASYSRADFREDILYAVVSYAGLNLLMAPGFLLPQDGWEKRHRARLDARQREEYTLRLRQRFEAMADDHIPFEALYAAALSVRRQVFGSAVDDLFLRDAEEADPLLFAVDFSQSARLEQLFRQARSILFLLEDARFKNLLREDLREAQQLELRCFAAYSATEAGCFPSDDLFRRLFPCSELRLLACEGALDQLEPDPELAADLAGNRVLVLCYGEKGLTDCRHLSVPAFIRCLPESLIGRALAGQFSHAGRCDIYVPPHFDIRPFVPVRKRSLASYRLFAFLSGREGDACYGMPPEALYHRHPEAFFSVYEEREPGFPRGLVWPEGNSTGDWYADFCARRETALSSVLESVPGVRRLGGWFSLDTLEEGPIPWTASGEARGILVHGFRLEKKVQAEVFLSEGEPLSPRHLAEEAGRDRISLFLNYLFFLTPRLAGLYNQLRADRPREQMQLPCGHLDYLRRRENEQVVETFPLFRKACMALKADGTFAFFHFRLGGGCCTIEGRTLRWSAADVDPESPGEIAVFTPYASLPDAGAPRMTYTKAVGRGRINLVIVKDRLLALRDGDVLLPAIGVVLSLRRDTGLALLDACGFGSLDAQGYCPLFQPPRVTICLDPPPEFSRESWSAIQWAYGGGLTLIHEGTSCFSSPEASAEHLSREGWSAPLSEQTQESDIAALVRHPRTAIGLTRSGHLFALVFSGRSSVSAGATYPEMCALAQKLVPDVWELMNVDGGGSSVLGIALDGRFIEYSCPSSSPATPAGLVRPVHSLLRVHIR